MPINIQNIQPIPTNQDDVLNAVERLLVTRLAISDKYIFQTTKPLVAIGNPPSGDYWLTISPGEGIFPDEWQIGGGANTVMELATTRVAAYTRIRTDSTDRDTNLLHDLKRGLLPIKRKLLKAMVGQQLYDDAAPNPNALCIRAIGIIRAEDPDYDKEKGTGFIVLHFATPFQWDLTT
ncbi:MAG TPA: hypothetical protein VG125_10525 [Pirellulales bacterium]|jgi:hypothetical protein|nr:hypothetical protein [Pirellulales bacterium]